MIFPKKVVGKVFIFFKNTNRKGKFKKKNDGKLKDKSDKFPTSKINGFFLVKNKKKVVGN